MDYDRHYPPLGRSVSTPPGRGMSAPTPPPSVTSCTQGGLDADRPDSPAELPAEVAPEPAEAAAPAVEDEAAVPAESESGMQAESESGMQAEAAGTGAQDETAGHGAPTESWTGEYQFPYYAEPHSSWAENPFMASLSTINQLTAMLAAAQFARAPSSGETQQQLAETQQQLAETQRQLAETQQQLVGTQQQLAGTQQELAGTQQQLAGAQQQIAGAKATFYDLQGRFETFMSRPPMPECALRACLDARGHCEHCAAFKSVKISPEGDYMAAICGDCIERIQRASGCGAPGCEERPYVSPLGEVSPYCANCWSAVEQQVLASKATEELLPAVDKALALQQAATRNAVPAMLPEAKKQFQRLNDLRRHIREVCESTVVLRKHTLRRKNVSDAKAAAKAARKRQTDAAAI